LLCGVVPVPVVAVRDFRVPGVLVIAGEFVTGTVFERCNDAGNCGIREWRFEGVLWLLSLLQVTELS
jgi:hypothetical protein